MPAKPQADPGLNCPLHRKPMHKVCHTCCWWVPLRGTDPQTGADVDTWNCAVAWSVMLGLENAQMERQTGAAVESMRNETARAGQLIAGAIIKSSKRLEAPHEHVE